MKTAAAADLRACCSALYASDWVRLLLGDSFHPGGLELTQRLGRLLGLKPGHRVLDLACGQGASALHLARTFGCRVTGLDYSSASLKIARQAARQAGLDELAAFEVGDVESLPFSDHSFDAVICECSLCTFPEKQPAVREMARVLRPGAAVGLSDLSRQADLAPELQSLGAWLGCIADAQTVEGYLGLLEGAALVPELVEPHDQALVDLVRTVRLRLLAGEVVSRLGQIQLPGLGLEAAKSIVRAAEQAVLEGRLGYLLIVARKDASTGGAGWVLSRSADVGDRPRSAHSHY